MCGNSGTQAYLSRAENRESGADVFQYRASTQLRYQSFDNCLEDEP